MDRKSTTLTPEQIRQMTVAIGRQIAIKLIVGGLATVATCIILKKLS